MQTCVYQVNPKILLQIQKAYLLNPQKAESHFPQFQNKNKEQLINVSTRKFSRKIQYIRHSEGNFLNSELYFAGTAKTVTRPNG